MKKIYITFLCTLVFYLCSFTSNAQESSSYIGEGYTPDGIHYIIYEIETTQSLQRTNTTIDVVRELQFQGIIQPPSTKYSSISKPSYPYGQEGYFILF